MNRFADRLKTLRQEKNLTISELALELKISPACISRRENGLRIPNLDSILILCNYFKCTADFLIGLEE